MNLHSETSLFKTDNQLNQLNYPVSLVDNKVALPIHIQNLEKALNLNSFLKQVHSLIDDKRDDKISLTLNKQQSKDVKSSMYSFNHNKTAKSKNSWLKNILIDNSDESDNEDIGQSVQQLLKIRKYKNKKQSTDSWPGKQDGKIGSSLSSNILSLNDSVPLSSLFKSEKSCKSQIKKPKTSKKKLKSGDPVKQQNDNPNDAKMLDDRPPSYALNSYFEPTLNSKPNDSYSLKKDYSDELHQLDSTSCLEASKLLDDCKYETTLADEMMLHSESNMNDFVNSFLTNMNDQIIYSNQLPDEIFETEEEISNGFHDNDYDLLNDNVASNTLAAHCEPPPLNEPPTGAVRSGSREAAAESGEPKQMNGTIEDCDDELNGNLGEHLSENLNYNCGANEHANRDLTSNSNSNPNSNSNEVQIEKDRTENADDHESEPSPIERQNETYPTSDQPTDSRQANLTKISPINLINSTTPINSINLANLVDSTMDATTTISAPIISASLPVNLISSLHNSNTTTTTTTTNLNGPVLSGSTSLASSTTLPNPVTLSNCPSKVIEPADAIVNGALSKPIAKKKVAGKALLAELEPEQMQNKRKKLWSSIAKKDIPKAYKSRLTNRKDVLNNCKKLAQCCQKERNSVLVPKLNRERSKKSNKEIATYWKLNKRNENNALTACEPLTATPVQLSG